MKPTKVPKKLPIFLVKASWRSTACEYKIPAKNASEAKERMWKQIAKTEGGDSCYEVVVIKEII
jgi:hypothetical protein